LKCEYYDGRSDYAVEVSCVVLPICCHVCVLILIFLHHCRRALNRVRCETRRLHSGWVKMATMTMTTKNNNKNILLLFIVVMDGSSEKLVYPLLLFVNQ